MHCLAGLDSITGGQVWIGDTELSALSDKALTRLRRDAVGFVFQAFNLVPTLTALENITLPLDIAGPQARPAVARHRHRHRRPARPAQAPAQRALRRPAAARRVRPRARQPARRSCSPTSPPATSTRRSGAEVLGLPAPQRRRVRPDHRHGHPRPRRRVVRRPRALPRRRPDRRRDAAADRRPVLERMKAFDAGTGLIDVLRAALRSLLAAQAAALADAARRRRRRRVRRGHLHLHRLPQAVVRRAVRGPAARRHGHRRHGGRPGAARPGRRARRATRRRPCPASLVATVAGVDGVAAAYGTVGADGALVIGADGKVVGRDRPAGARHHVDPGRRDQLALARCRVRRRPAPDQVALLESTATAAAARGRATPSRLDTPGRHGHLDGRRDRHARHLRQRRQHARRVRPPHRPAAAARLARAGHRHRGPRRAGRVAGGRWPQRIDAALPRHRDDADRRAAQRRHRRPARRDASSSSTRSCSRSRSSRCSSPSSSSSTRSRCWSPSAPASSRCCARSARAAARCAARCSPRRRCSACSPRCSACSAASLVSQGLRLLLKAFGADLPSGPLVIEPRTIVVSLRRRRRRHADLGVRARPAAPRVVPPVAAMRDEVTLPARSLRVRTVDRRASCCWLALVTARPGCASVDDGERGRAASSASPRCARWSRSSRSRRSSVAAVLRVLGAPFSGTAVGPPGARERPAQPAPHRGHRERAGDRAGADDRDRRDRGLHQGVGRRRHRRHHRRRLRRVRREVPAVHPRRLRRGQGHPGHVGGHLRPAGADPGRGRADRAHRRRAREVPAGRRPHHAVRARSTPSGSATPSSTTRRQRTSALKVGDTIEGTFVNGTARLWCCAASTPRPAPTSAGSPRSRP